MNRPQEIFPLPHVIDQLIHSWLVPSLALTCLSIDWWNRPCFSCPNHGAISPLSTSKTLWGDASEFRSSPRSSSSGSSRSILVRRARFESSTSSVRKWTARANTRWTAMRRECMGKGTNYETKKRASKNSAVCTTARLKGVLKEIDRHQSLSTMLSFSL